MAAKKPKKSIKIKPANKGKLRKEMGKSTKSDAPPLKEAELRKKLAAAKKAGNTALVKRLTFALNAKKWGK